MGSAGCHIRIGAATGGGTRRRRDGPRGSQAPEGCYPAMPSLLKFSSLAPMLCDSATPVSHFWATTQSLL